MNGSVQDIILLVGDSLTQGASIPWGFANRLSYVYNRKFDVINRGFGGYNTTWTMAALKQCLVKRTEVTDSTAKVRIVTIWLGANDSVIPEKEQYVPLAQFSENLVEMIQMFSSPSSEYYSPETKIILLTPPPVNTHQRGADLASRDPPLQLDRAPGVAAQYADAVREVAKQENVPVVDVYTRLWEGCGKDEKSLTKYLTDGLHVNEEAYGLIFDDIMQVISTNWPELHYDNLQPVFPMWDTIDPKHPDVQKRVIVP